LTAFVLEMTTNMSGYDPDPAGSAFNRPPRSRSGSVIQNYGSTDPDPKEISSDPNHY